MEADKFYDFFSRLLVINLIMSILFSITTFLFNISMLNIAFAVLPIAVKLVFWFSRDNFIYIDEITEKAKLVMTLSFITLYFAIDAIIYHNFLPASIFLIIPIFALALKKDIEIVKLESIITVVFMSLILIVSIFITPFKSNFLTDLMLFIVVLIQFLMIIKRYTEETLSISAKSDFFMDKSKRDGMTGLYNNSTFYDTVAEKVQLMAPFCIIIINIDNFKAVKDAYGQPFGLYVIKTLVKTIKKTCRSQDTAYRFNGEDIAVVFPKTTEDDAFRIAEKIRKNFNEMTYEHNTEWVRSKKPITISIGLIESNKRGAMPQELIEKCDQALFYSIQNGKNQTTMYHEHIKEWEDKFEDFRRKYRNYER